MKIEENEIYTTKEVAEILKISLPTVKRMLKDGRLLSIRIGKQHRFLGKDLLSMLEASREMPPALPEKPAMAAVVAVRPAPVHGPAVSEAERGALLGRRVLEPVMGRDGQILINPGVTVTDEIIESARDKGCFSQLTRSVQAPEGT
jgi:excisionase family DNA binding protein